MATSDTAFTGSIPAIYDRCLGPLLFEPYAREVARRAAEWRPADILETAAGTGIVTAHLARALPEARLVATDLNPAMLEVARQRLDGGRVELQPADALDLPFADESFDLVVCQFGVMFYPDRVRGNAEARRVLRDGGRYLAVIWDRLEANPVGAAIHRAMAEVFPDDPPQFLARTPWGYGDPEAIERDLEKAGFSEIEIETVEAASDPVSPADAALGLTQGSPLRAEIEARGVERLDEATAAAEKAVRALGRGDTVTAPLSALFVTAIR